MYEVKCNTSLGYKMRIAAIEKTSRSSKRNWVVERILTNPSGNREDVAECKEIYKNIVSRQ